MVTLSYVHDPMCSWCWGYRPVWEQVIQLLPSDFVVRYVLGGLAPDTDEPMPEAMQSTIKATWKRIQKEIPDTRFNFDFWTRCRPRRSTYPACRAVIAASRQQPHAGPAMILAIQHAYYLEARNPSDDDVLVALADTMGLDTSLFERFLGDAHTRKTLQAEFVERDRLGAHSFPALFIENENGIQPVPLDYRSARSQLSSILSAANSTK